MILTFLIAIQAFTMTSFGASLDYLDQNLDAYYKHVEGQDAKYSQWMQLERERIVQPVSINYDSIINNTYGQLENPSYIAPARLTMTTAYDLYAAPASFYTSPQDPFADEYLKYFKLQMDLVKQNAGIR